VRPPAPSRSAAARRWQAAILWVAIALASAGVVSGAVYVLEGPGSQPAQAEGRAPEGSDARAALAPSKTPRPPAPPVPDIRETPPIELPVVLPPGTPIQLVVKTMPADATILLDNKRLGRSPFIGKVPAASGIHTLKIRKKGYVTVSLDIELVNNVTREVMLQRVKEP
jgi:hypothetical protein